MKCRCGGVLAMLLCSVAGIAETSGDCGHPLQVPLRPRAELAIDSRPAGIEIVGTDQDVVRVSCTVDDANEARRIEVRLSGDQDETKLTISGEAMKGEGVHVRVEVPRRTDLQIYTPAGQVEVEKVAGDKDIDLYAGQIRIISGDPSDYRTVDASVGIGEVKASAYGIEKGGFFRSFRRETPGGEYRLRVRVLTGQIDLE